MWTNDYRPTSLDEVVGNDVPIKRLVSTKHTSNIQHMIIHGPSGIGKKMTCRLFANALLGRTVKDNLLEINVSDERGIQIIRDRVFQFVPQVTVDTNVTKRKLVVFHEADNIGDGVQHMLRRMMENNDNNTIFIFICEVIELIIEAIQSRCHVLCFNAIETGDIAGLLEKICLKEQIQCDSPTIRYIASMSGGNIGKAVNYLQTCFCISKKTIDLSVVRTTCVFPHFECIRATLKSCANYDIYAALNHIKTLWSHGYSNLDILMFVQDYYIETQRLRDAAAAHAHDMSEKLIAEDDEMHGICAVSNQLQARRALHLCLIREVGQSHTSMYNCGVNSLCQLYGLVSRLCKIYDEFKSSSNQLES